MRSTPITSIPVTPRELLISYRRLIRRRGHTITSLARTARIPRARLNQALNGKDELTSPQWRRFYAALGIFDQVIAALKHTADRA